MYQVGQWIIYGGEGACQVEAIGPLAMRGANREIGRASCRERV